MKRLSIFFALGLFVSFCCFSQVQTGNASYNATKKGFTISHSSLSWDTYVRITNLQNNKSVEASVNGRINSSPERIADISGDAGDVLGMKKDETTLIKIEILGNRIGYQQNLIINAEAKRARDAGTPILILNYYTTKPNSAGGIDFFIDFINLSTKRIKYAYVTIEPYNRVDDRVDKSETITYTGYFEPNVRIYPEGGVANVWYNRNIAYVKITKLVLTYDDNSIQTVENELIEKSLFKSEKEMDWGFGYR
jgi:hypothetical protein